LGEGQFLLSYYLYNFSFSAHPFCLCVCVWRWTHDLSRGSRCKSRWERRCI